MAALIEDVPTEEEMQAARESVRELAPYLGRSEGVRVEIVGGEEEPRTRATLPPVALRLLNTILSELAQGNAVTVTPVHAELTTQQAADFLNVSRPFLIGLLEKGEIPHHRVGTHRRVLAEDLIRYKQESRVARKQALVELAAQAQELEMGY